MLVAAAESAAVRAGAASTCEDLGAIAGRKSVAG
jgi:hypothetical protein